MDIELNADELQIALTPEEIESSDANVLFITFAITTKGNLCITEELSNEEERYGDSHSVTIPMRIWIEGLKWLETKAETG